MKKRILILIVCLTFILLLMISCEKQVTVTSISIEGQKNYFDLGEGFSLGDISAYATMSNGVKTAIQKNDLYVNFSEYDSTKPGKYKVYVTYCGVSEQYEVVVSKFSSKTVYCGELMLSSSNRNTVPVNARNGEKYLQYEFTPSFSGEYILMFILGKNPTITLNGNTLSDIQNDNATIKLTKDVRYIIEATINDESLTLYGLFIKLNDRLFDISLMEQEEYLLCFNAPSSGIINISTSSESVKIERIMTLTEQKINMTSYTSFNIHTATPQLTPQSQVQLFCSASNDVYILIKNYNSISENVAVNIDYLEVPKLQSGNSIETEITPNGGLKYYELNVTTDSCLTIDYSIEPRISYVSQLYNENGEKISGYSITYGSFCYPFLSPGRYFIGFYLHEVGVLNAEITFVSILE